MRQDAYMVPNPMTPGQIIIIDPDICTGCNTCVDVCRTDVLVPNPETGQPPITLYPDECWFCGCCMSDCPNDALKIDYPLNQRMGWRRKETGEYFRLGMKNPPAPNTRPSV